MPDIATVSYFPVFNAHLWGSREVGREKGIEGEGGGVVVREERVLLEVWRGRGRCCLVCLEPKTFLKMQHSEGNGFQ
jgi:hypothetical protein